MTNYRRRKMAGITPFMRGMVKGILFVYSAACIALFFHVITR